MSAVEQRDFSNFYLGDDVLRLNEGIVRVAADWVGFELPKPPDDDLSEEQRLEWRVQANPEIDTALYGLAGVYGKDKVLRNNDEVNIHPAMAAGLLRGFNIMGPQARSMQTPEVAITGKEDLILASAGIGGWCVRTVDTMIEHAETVGGSNKASIQAGNRVMKAPGDLRTPAVGQFMEKHEGQHPKEYELAEEYMGPRLEAAGYEVELGQHETGDGLEIARNFVKAHPEFFMARKKLVIARVAGAVLQLACDYRTAARESYPLYDRFASDPDLFMLSGSFPIAETRVQIADPDNFQSPYTGSRSALVSAHKLNQQKLPTSI